MTLFIAFTHSTTLYNQIQFVSAWNIETVIVSLGNILFINQSGEQYNETVINAYKKK